MELEDEPDEPPAPIKPARQATRKKPSGRKTTDKKAPRRPAVSRKPAKFNPTSRSVTQLRKKLGMSRPDFARAVGVSAATVANWENARGPIRPHARGLQGLQRLYDEA